MYVFYRLNKGIRLENLYSDMKCSVKIIQIFTSCVGTNVSFLSALIFFVYCMEDDFVFQ
jgi:hypothetical protein